MEKSCATCSMRIYLPQYNQRSVGDPVMFPHICLAQMIHFIHRQCPGMKVNPRINKKGETLTHVNCVQCGSRIHHKIAIRFKSQYVNKSEVLCPSCAIKKGLTWWFCSTFSHEDVRPLCIPQHAAQIANDAHYYSPYGNRSSVVIERQVSSFGEGSHNRVISYQALCRDELWENSCEGYVRTFTPAWIPE